MLLEPAPAAPGTGCLCASASAPASDAACARLTGDTAGNLIVGRTRHAAWRVVWRIGYR
jgi:hypothetical protein